MNSPFRAPDILLIEAVDETAAQAHFDGLLMGTTAAVVRRLVPGVYVTTGQESGRWWKFSAYVNVVPD